MNNVADDRLGPRLIDRVARFELIDMRAHAEVPSARRTDTHFQASLQLERDWDARKRPYTGSIKRTRTGILLGSPLPTVM
jgi:hypothetical protein